MNPAQLSALFATHKTAALGAAAAGVVGLALYRKKKGAAAPAPASTAGVTLGGTLPAAAVGPVAGSTGGQGYDSSSYDTYNALQPELAQILQAQQALATSASAPAAATVPAKPIASGLFQAQGNGNYVRYGDGTIGEVESDGSIYGIAKDELMASGTMWNPSMGATPLPWQHWNDNPSSEPLYGDKVHNLVGAGGGTLA